MRNLRCAVGVMTFILSAASEVIFYLWVGTLVTKKLPNLAKPALKTQQQLVAVAASLYLIFALLIV